MKKLLAIAILGTICFSSCAQKEEKREDYKQEHNKDFKRNSGVPTDAMSDSTQVEDSVEAQTK